MSENNLSFLGDFNKISRKRKLSKILFRYILKDLIVVLLSATLGFAVILLVFSLMEELDDFIKEKVSTLDMVMYFIYIQPQVLLQVMPFSLMLGTMYNMAQMARNSELSAMRAMGISVLGVYTPIIIMATTIGIMMMLVQEFVVPYSQKEVQRIEAIEDGVEDLSKKRSNAFLAFHNREDRRNWTFSDVSKDGVLKDLYLQQFGDQKRVKFEIIAKEAHYDEQKQQWVFTNGVYTVLDDYGIYAQKPEKFDTLSRSFNERAKGLYFFTKLNIADTLSIKDLLEILNYEHLKISDTIRNRLKIDFYSRFIVPFTCLIAILLASPIVLTTKRTGAMNHFMTGSILMGVYYLCKYIFAGIGTAGFLPPLIAVWIPVILFVSIALYLLKRKS